MSSMNYSWLTNYNCLQPCLQAWEQTQGRADWQNSLKLKGGLGSKLLATKNSWKTVEKPRLGILASPHWIASPLAPLRSIEPKPFATPHTSSPFANWRPLGITFDLHWTLWLPEGQHWDTIDTTSVWQLWDNIGTNLRQLWDHMVIS